MGAKKVTVPSLDAQRAAWLRDNGYESWQAANEDGILDGGKVPIDEHTWFDWTIEQSRVRPDVVRGTDGYSFFSDAISYEESYPTVADARKDIQRKLKLAAKGYNMAAKEHGEVGPVEFESAMDQLA